MIRVFCSEYKPKDYIERKGDCHLSCLDHNLSLQNVDINFSALKEHLLNKDFYAFDLILIAVYVYIADRLIKRGSKTAIYDENWSQDIEFYIPVKKPMFWKQRAQILQEMFTFAVGHRYKFHFVSDRNRSERIFLEGVLEADHSEKGFDCISLFSGGLDSLSSTLELLKAGRKPLLISHKTTGKISSYRDRLCNLLNQSYENLIKWEMTINLKRKSNADRTKEYTQRSRSILYACLGIGFAKCLNIQDVYLSDNGIISLNLPCTESNKGTQLTRSSNPKLLEYINELSADIWDEGAPNIENLLLDKTKAEVIQQIVDFGHSDLITETSSCVDTKGMSKSAPFCGECSQCFERRFAVEYLRIPKHLEPRSKYRFDILTDSLDGHPIAKTHYENFFRRARFFIEHKNDDETVYKRYPEIMEYCPIDQSKQGFLRKAAALYSRQAEELNSVTGTLMNKMRKKDIQENSLLDIEYRYYLALNEQALTSDRDNEHDFMPQDKLFALFVNGKSLYLRDCEIDLSEKQFDITHSLFLTPHEYISYSQLLEGENKPENNAYASSAMQAHKRTIRKNIIRASKRKAVQLVDSFTPMKSKAKFGYRIDEWFYKQIQPK